MSIPLIVNGVTYDYPEVDDVDWGPDATDWAAAVTSGMLQKTAGLFQLLAEVDFGTSYGVKSLYFKSRTANVADSGQIRLARADVLSWRNQANSANLDLAVNASNLLTFNGTVIQNTLSVSDTTTIDLTLSSDVLSADIRATSIVNSMISASAAIAYSKLALTGSIVNADLANMAQSTIKGRAASSGTGAPVDLTATQATAILNNFVGDSGSGGTKGLVLAPAAGDAAANKFLGADGTWKAAAGGGDVTGPGSATDNGFVRFDGTTGKLIKNSAATIVNADVSASAAIAYSKLNLSTSIVNADVNAAAAIAYSKLNLALSIVNADVSASAAIAFSKLASLTSAHILVGSAGNVPTDVAVSGDISLTNAGVTAYSGVVPLVKGGTGTAAASANAAFNALSPMTTGGDVIYGGASGAATRLANGSSAQVLTSAGGTSAPTWNTPRQPNLVVQSKTANYTVLTTDDLLIGSGSAFTFSLFTAVGNAGKVLRFNNVDATAATNTVTVDPNGTETINGQLTFVLTGQYQSLTIASDGANWQILDFDPAGENLSSFSTPQKQASATDRYQQYAGGNSLTLTPGTWRLFGNAYFTNSGLTPGYLTASVFWGAANGADTNVSPADISTVTGLTVLSTGQNFMGAGMDGSNNCVAAPEYLVRVTQNATIYLDTYLTVTTASRTRITVYLNAERLQ